MDTTATIATLTERVNVLDARKVKALEKYSVIAQRDHMQGPAYSKAYAAMVRADRLVTKALEELRAAERAAA